MGLLERVNARTVRSARPRALTIDEYAQWFSYGGTQYPIMQTTYNGVDRERIAYTADHAAKTSSPVFALILARMQVFSQVRFRWTRLVGAQPSDLFGTPELSVVEQPFGPGSTTSDLLKRMEWDASTAGSAYIRRRANMMHRLYPPWVVVVLGSQENAAQPQYAADTVKVGYFYTPPDAEPRFFRADQVAHHAPIPDPDTHFLGQSWITAVLRELQGDQAATEHKYKFFENAATPNIAIRFDPAVTIRQAKEFKALIEEEHEGIASAFKTLYLGGGADPVTVGSSFKDMDYAVIQGRAESRLAAAAGVPPSWVGFAEGLQGSSLNAGNFNAARRRFSDGTMADLWASASSALQAVLSTPPGAVLWPDTRIPFMRVDEAELAAIQQNEATTIRSLVDAGFTPDSAVAAVRNNDWTLLVHTGLYSVQLQAPNTTPPQTPALNVPALNGNGRAH